MQHYLHLQHAPESYLVRLAAVACLGGSRLEAGAILVQVLVQGSCCQLPGQPPAVRTQTSGYNPQNPMEDPQPVLDSGLHGQRSQYMLKVLKVLLTRTCMLLRLPAWW